MSLAPLSSSLPTITDHKPETVSPAVCCTFLPPHIIEAYATHLRQNAEENQERIARLEGTLQSMNGYREIRHAGAEAKGIARRIGSAVWNAGAWVGGLLPRWSQDTEVPIHIYNAGQQMTDVGVLVKPEEYGEDEQRVLHHTRTFVQFMQKVLGRNSVDDRGMPLESVLHVGPHFDNAAWTGSKMIFGDGDEIQQHQDNIFGCFTEDGDVNWHELGHAVVQFLANFPYKDQSGALNEHMADVFGVVAKQWSESQQLLGPQRDTTWLIGETTIKAIEDQQYAIRSMKAPGTAYVDHPVLGTDPQRPTMSGYVETDKDNGGVHINSGIPNHAFYLVATALGGNSWESALPIWYAALHELHGDTDFVTFAKATLACAEKLGEREHEAVLNAWQTVEVLPSTELVDSE